MDFGLKKILLPSLMPCKSFDGVCAGHMRWQPQDGHVPRGWFGATGSLEEVKLVLVTQEPGNPANNESFDNLVPENILHKYQALSMDWLQNNTVRRGKRIPPFHRNIMTIISLCWPNLSFEEQLRKTWVTPTVLCSPTSSGQNIPHNIEIRCGNDYFLPQLALLESVFIISLGEKAQKRLAKLGIKPNAHAQHPSARPNTQPRLSWELAAKLFHTTSLSSY